MKVFGFDKVPLETILDYIKTNDVTSRMSQVAFTSHFTDFRFSDKYILKQVKEHEFVSLSIMIDPKTESQKKLYPFLPTIYGLIFDSTSDEMFVAMQNCSCGDTCSQLEVKLGRIGFIPPFWEKKQYSKLTKGLEFGISNVGYRICVAKRKNGLGEDISKVTREINAAGKIPITYPKFDCVFFLTDDDLAAKRKAFLIKALDFFIQKVEELKAIFSEGVLDLGIMATGNSIIFYFDLYNETFDIKYIDFGNSFPASRLDLWKDEQIEALEDIIKELQFSKEQILNQTEPIANQS